MHGVVSIDKDKKNTLIVDKMTQYVLIKAGIYIVVPQQK